LLVLGCCDGGCPQALVEPWTSAAPEAAPVALPERVTAGFASQLASDPARTYLTQTYTTGCTVPLLSVTTSPSAQRF
jgi:hypothetical protein